MSDLAFVDEPSRSDGPNACPDTAVVERTAWRTAEIAPGVSVERALPLRKRRTVGAWCFLDLAGPFDPARGVPMDIGPHPHIGLQTLTWLFDGEALHRDSLGTEQVIRKGELNLMTSGSAVVHSEHSPRDVSGGGVHLAQLWIALPEATRHGAAAFEHHATLPTIVRDGLTTTVLIGEHEGAQSAATVHTPIVGLDTRVTAGTNTRIPITPDFEHAAVVVDGELTIAGERLGRGELLYLGRHRTELTLASDTGARLIVLGGEPFESEILMWWNFVARDRGEVEQARSDWLRDAGFDGGDAAPTRFLRVPGDDSPSLPAPGIPWATKPTS